MTRSNESDGAGPLKGDAFLSKLAELVNQHNPDKPPVSDDLGGKIMGEVRRVSGQA